MLPRRAAILSDEMFQGIALVGSAIANPAGSNCNFPPGGKTERK